MSSWNLNVLAMLSHVCCKNLSTGIVCQTVGSCVVENDCCVTVDKSVREEDRSEDKEKDENVKDNICQLLNQRTASQRRDKSCAPSH